MHALAVQHVIGAQEETRCHNIEESLKFPMPSPEEQWRFLFAEVHQIVVEDLRLAEVLLEEGPG